MTATELAKMVYTMRDQGANIPNRCNMECQLHRLICGLRSIGRTEIVNELEQLYDEIENVDTFELAATGIFHRNGS